MGSIAIALSILFLIPNSEIRQIRVLSVIGECMVGDTALEAKKQIPRGSEIKLNGAGNIQVLADWRLSVGVKGPARLTFESTRIKVTTAKLLRVAGTHAEIVFPHYTVVLGGEGASFLYHRGEIFALSGKFSVRAHTSAAPSIAVSSGQSMKIEGLRTSQPSTTSEAPTTSQPSSMASQAQISSEKKPSPEALRQSMMSQPPPLWIPKTISIDPKQIVKARKVTQERQRDQREMATCGCTEGGNTVAREQIGSGGGVTPEHRASHVRIKITGLPKKIVK